MTTGKNVAVECCRHHETETGILVSDDGNEGNAIWLPKPFFEIQETDNKSVVISLPEWLAMEKGLI